MAVVFLRFLFHLSRPKLLPCVVGMACLLLSLRVSNIFYYFFNKSEPIIHIAEEAYGSSLPSPTPINPPQEQPDYPPATPQIQPISLDPLTMTENDVKILLDLSRRRTELDKQEQKLQEKEQFLKALQDQLTAKIDELMSLKKSVETLVKTFDNRNKESAEKLARYYEGMKPKEAAKILEQLELSILLPVIQHMNQRKVPPILASMDVAKVREITTKIAETQNLLENKKP